MKGKTNKPKFHTEERVRLEPLVPIVEDKIIIAAGIGCTVKESGIKLDTGNNYETAIFAQHFPEEAERIIKKQEQEQKASQIKEILGLNNMGNFLKPDCVIDLTSINRDKSK